MTTLAVIFGISSVLTLVSLLAVVFCSPWSRVAGSRARTGSYSRAFFVRAWIGLAVTSAGTLLAGYALVAV